jgi:hypothetical protein
MRQLVSFGLLPVAVASVVSCKPRSFNNEAASAQGGKVASVAQLCQGRFAGKLPSWLMAKYGADKDAALRLNKTPWSDWAALKGADGADVPSSLMSSLKNRAQDYDGMFSGLVRGVTNKMAETSGKVNSEIGMLVGLVALEVQRADLLRCNMWDTNGTIDTHPIAAGGTPESPGADQRWASLQSPNIKCEGDNLKFRTLDGVCNDPLNPLMGAKGQRFGRNVSFAATQKRAGVDLMSPDPNTVARVLLSRKNPNHEAYRQAPFFNVLAASWIQFMTHDWFSHSSRGNNEMDESRALRTAGGSVIPSTKVDSNGQPAVSSRVARPPNVYKNTVSFWWDASQIYGADADLAQAVRDPKNRALMLVDKGMLPRFDALTGGAPTGLHAHEKRQEVTGFPDNWWVGLSVLNTLFAREHNRFVTELARRHFGVEVTKLNARQQDEAYNYGRLYISALIAKIHTIEWTPQLLFNPVLDAGMNSNWHGIAAHRFGEDNWAVKRFESLSRSVLNTLRTVEAANIKPGESSPSNKIFAFGVAAPGIVGGRANHFGVPFTLPEEFTTVYRLHPLLPDVLKYRKATDLVAGRATEGNFEAVATENTARAKSADVLTQSTFNDWLVSIGTQPTGTLQLDNYPRFLQNLEIPHAPAWTQSAGQSRKIDLAAVDILRDRERGVPRYNEFRRQIGLQPISSLNDFINQETAYQVFTGCGQKFDPSQLKKDIVSALNCPANLKGQRDELMYQIDQRDRLAQVYGNDADAIERIDTLVGIFAENTRPYGFALSETQFQIFVLNASRRLFSDRFFSTDFNAKTYTEFGMKSLAERGMRDVIADNAPELAPVMAKVCNAFDPWTRPRNRFSVAWGFDSRNYQGSNCSL